MIGVILYGPPAAGKDTVTAALQQLDPRYRLFPRIKVGAGRTDGYRILSHAEADKLIQRGDIVWENRRYGARYLIDRSGLVGHLRQFNSVIHLGQAPAVDAVLKAAPGAHWIVASLRCSRDAALERIRDRGTGDDQDRIIAWDETEELRNADLFIDTSHTAPEDAASQIARKVLTE